MNSLPWRSLGIALNAIRHSLIGVGLMSGLSKFLYAQNATSTPESYILTVERCVKYVESAQWVYRDYQWSFSVTPTPCARRTPPEGTPYLWDELTRDYSNSRYWKNTHGMRHQLICHLVIARDKPQWNLEPWRPDVGHAKTLAAGCNHVVPLPEIAP